MGILNVTPDSFSDGGHWHTPETAFFRAAQMVEEGVDIIDLGGESTRPGAPEVSAQEECDRVIPVLERIKGSWDIPVSVDTSKASVMQAAIGSGADMINDVNALQAEGALAVAASFDGPLCLMHMQGTPKTMQTQPHYVDVVEEVEAFLHERLQACQSAGIKRERIILDPGFGFGKSLEHNVILLKQLARYKALGCPILVGLSRKSMIGALLNKPIEQRLYGSLSAMLLAVLKGASIVRVHDVGPTVDALRILNAVEGERSVDGLYTQN